MFNLSHSAFLQALGYAIANSLWQLALLWIVFVILNSIFKFSSHAKYITAVVAQLTGFVWFAITFKFYFTQCSNAVEAAKVLANNTPAYIIESATTSRSTLLNVLIKIEQVLPYLSVAYLLLGIILFIRWIRCYRHTQFIKTNGLSKAGVDIKLYVIRVSEQLGIKRKVFVYLSDIISSPMIIGFFKPVVLLPVASVANLSVAQLEAVLLHELAHIKRQDYLLNLVLSIIEIGLFFNPFTQLLSKAIKRERENSCDDWVLQFQYSPVIYAQALMQIATMQPQPAFAMNAVRSKGDLLHRVRRMVDKKQSTFNYKQQLLALFLMTAILSCIAWYNPNELNSKKQKASVQSVVIEPMAAKVSNPLFNPAFFLSEPLQNEVKRSVNLAAQSVKHQLPMLEKQMNMIMPAVNNGLQAAHESIKNLQLELPGFVADNMSFSFDSAILSKEISYALSNVDINWNEINAQLKAANAELEKAAAQQQKQQAQAAAANAKQFSENINKAFASSFIHLNKDVKNTAQKKGKLSATWTFTKDIVNKELTKARTTVDSAMQSVFATKASKDAALVALNGFNTEDFYGYNFNIPQPAEAATLNNNTPPTPPAPPQPPRFDSSGTNGRKFIRITTPAKQGQEKKHYEIKVPAKENNKEAKIIIDIN